MIQLSRHDALKKHDHFGGGGGGGGGGDGGGGRWRAETSTVSRQISLLR